MAHIRHMTAHLDMAAGLTRCVVALGDKTLVLAKDLFR